MWDNTKSYELEGEIGLCRKGLSRWKHCSELFSVLWLCTFAQATYCQTLQLSFVLECKVLRGLWHGPGKEICINILDEERKYSWEQKHKLITTCSQSINLYSWETVSFRLKYSQNIEVLYITLPSISY